MIGRVSPAECHLAIVQLDQTPVRDGNAMGITREILEDVFGSSERRSDFNHPSRSTQFAKETIESLRPFERLELA